MELEPDFTVIVAGQDRSDVLRSRLQRLRISETTGGEADEIELEFDDRDSAVALPAHGAQLDVSIGWKGDALVRLGLFTVDDTELAGPPDRVIVKAKSADVRASLKSHRHRAWRATTAQAIVTQIAAEHQLQPQVHPDLAGIQVTHRDQAGESDLHFLTRMGRDHDAVASVKAGRLVYAPKGQAVSASGQGLQPITLDRTDLSDWRMTNSDRAKHARVRARHRDVSAAADTFVEAGEGDPSKTLRHAYSTAATATSAAHAEHRRLKRQAHQVEVSGPGKPAVFAGMPLVLTGLRDGINGRWIAARVEHDIDMASGGFTTRIEATVDGASADTGDETQSYGGDDADEGAA